MDVLSPVRSRVVARPGSEATIPITNRLGRLRNVGTPAALVFRARALTLVVLLVGSIVVPELGSRRWMVTAGIALLVVYNLVLARLTSRNGRFPAWIMVTDPAVTLVFGLIDERFWWPMLLALTATIALVATAFETRIVVGVFAVCTAGVVATGLETQEPGTTLLGAFAFAGAGLLGVVPPSILRGQQQRLARSHAEIINSLEAAVWETDAGSDEYRLLEGRLVGVLGGAAGLTRISDWMLEVHPDDRERVAAVRAGVAASRRTAEVDYRFDKGNGTWRWFHESISADARGTLRGLTVEVTELRAAEQGRAMYSEVVDHIETALVVARIDDRGALVVTAVNPALARMLGATSVSIVGQRLADILHNLDPSIRQRAMAVAQGGESFQVERVEGVGIDQTKVFSLQVFGLPNQAVGIGFEDVTSAAMVAAALRRQALHDGLTGLPNRTLLRDRLRTALADARRRDERVALILMDLNHFKEVNDALGHQYGDQLLVAFAKRLQELLRECDTIARLGGDEFALLLTNATNEGASRVVKKVTAAMQDPFDLDGVTIQATASLGVALFPDHGEDADLLTQRADVAMYTAKRGGGGWAIYSPAHDQSSVERLTLLSELHRELEAGKPAGLSLAYQPILDLHTDQVTGAEALLRWEHPHFGSLRPELVVELAELSGLINPLARMVAGEAMETCRRWSEQGQPLRIAINLSARNLYDRHLITWLRELLDATGVPPHLLKCELTESEVMDDPVLAMDVLSAMRDAGIHTAIDDFGTGYSSLAYLRKLPVDEIKIDKSFVINMFGDRHNVTIVKTVIDLAHNLGMDVLAEGVEDLEVLDTLREFGCDRIQGFYVGHPMTAEDFWERLPTMTDGLTANRSLPVPHEVG